MKSIIKLYLLSPILVMLMIGCQKTERPVLGEYPTDESKPPLPAGELRFFVPFGDDPQKRYEVKDSISGDPAQVHPFSLTEGINGKAVQGTDAGNAIKYMNVNDFGAATSFTIAFWMKNTDKGRTEFVFSLVDDKYGWHHSAIFLLLEHGDATATTLKLGVMDQWLEFPDSKKFAKPLMDGNWHHIAFVYDETTSKMAYYFDGAMVEDAPASATDVKKDGNPRGAVDLTTIKNLVLAGWNRHAKLAGPTDDWIKSYTGALDQFRLYNKALSATEINALFAGKL